MTNLTTLGSRRPPTVLHLPPSGPPRIPAPTSPTTQTFFSDQWRGAGPRRRWLIYFVTGNPGLVGYYDLFLSHLHFLLGAHPTLAPRNAFEVLGRSLSGFEARGWEGSWPAAVDAGKGKAGEVMVRDGVDGAVEEKERLLKGEAEAKAGSGAQTARTAAPPFGLEQQIEGAEWVLWDHVRGMREVDEDGAPVLVNGVGGEHGDGTVTPTGAADEEPRVIVIGHSLGAYVSMEIMRRWRESLRREGDGDGVETEKGRIVGGVCLFPALTHLAKSSSGIKATMLLELIPHLPLIAHILAALLTFWIPTAILVELIGLLTGHPSDAASVTVGFLKSPHGVRQALHLARDELEHITHDAWDDEVWGAAAPSPLRCPRPKMFCLFGKEDHWVADETRDELIKVRGRTRGGGEESWKPLMEVDETGIPHGFCIVILDCLPQPPVSLTTSTDPNHSIAVAEKVARYIEEIVRAEATR